MPAIKTQLFPRLTGAILPFACLVLVATFVSTANAQSGAETVDYNFPGGGNGANPYSNLVADSSGNLYGTTGGGGNSTNCSLGSGCGTVFELSLQAGVWTETILYSFQGGNDGASPQAGLVFDKTGSLYGTTSSGGGAGVGTAFKLAPPATAGGAWKESVLYTFKGGTDGSYPASGLIFDGTLLVGTTPFGGASNFGTVFELTPVKTVGAPWKETILYNFTGLGDGGKPYGSLVLRSGALYGTVLDGGPSGQGAVFELTDLKTVWSEKVLYGFTGGADGGKPYANIIFSKTGDIYGTTGLGGADGYGTVFELVPPTKTVTTWKESVLYSFTGGPDGSYARYGVVVDTAGNLYGTTGVGSSNSGVVFKLSPPTKTVTKWTETVLWTFSGGGDGGDPTAGLVLYGGNLYGTTSTGGEYSKGTVFEVVP